MTFISNEIESYVVGALLSLTLYGVMYKLIPAIYGRLRQKAKSPFPVTARPQQELALATFPFPFREIAGTEAMQAYSSAKEEGHGVPVIVGGGTQELARMAHHMASRKETPNDFLRMALADPHPLRRKTKPKLPKTWPSVGPFNDFNPFVLYNLNLQIKDRVTLAIIPAQASWQVPAYLKHGGWNGHVDAHVKVALLRKWQQHYGAELVAVTADAMDIHINRKPATREEALSLAQEHRAFCPTNVATLAEIAAELMLLDWWQFWWD